MNSVKTLFPITITNTFYGLKISLYGFLLFIGYYLYKGFNLISMNDLSALMGEESVFAVRILDQLGISSIILQLLNFWGLSILLITVVFILVILRYKALIPFMYVVMFIENVALFFMLGSDSTMSSVGSSILSVSTLWLIGLIPLFLGLSLIPNKASFKP